MKTTVRKIIPQNIINRFWHFPQAYFANLRHNFPSRKLKIIGVTGTDGKTTTTNMIYQILKSGGKKVSMVSTINAMIGDQAFDTGFHVTSPDPQLAQKFVKEAVKQGSEYMVLEVTSHALDQFRFWGIKFEIGVITNITREHLDYHKSLENYFNTKATLIKNVKLAVLNHDEKHFENLSKKTSGKVVSFGLHKNANFNPLKFPFKLQIPGEFNVLNGLAASAVGVSLGIKADLIKKTLENFVSLEGRMEYIKNDKGLTIVVDFAHTPNGVEQALKALKQKTGKLIALIGAEGYRDTSKRALIGEIAVKQSDIVIITSVDPRGLSDEINEQIMEGCKRAGGELNKNVFIENDRQKAIDMAINKLGKTGDTIALLGKGHEKSMNLDGKIELPWSDKQAAQKALGA